jgi:hypothetical protein
MDGERILNALVVKGKHAMKRVHEDLDLHQENKS